MNCNCFNNNLLTQIMEIEFMNKKKCFVPFFLKMLVKLQGAHNMEIVWNKKHIEPFQRSITVIQFPKSVMTAFAIVCFIKL